jgi:hypothetical protein
MMAQMRTLIVKQTWAAERLLRLNEITADERLAMVSLINAASERDMRRGANNVAVDGNSDFGVTRGKAFSLKFAEATECRRKKLWQHDLPAESFQIILPKNYSARKLSEFYSEFDEVIA